DLGAFNVLVLFHFKEPIEDEHANLIYQALKDFKEHKDILLLIESGGGRIEPAYLIRKRCKTLKANKFVVAIAPKAKSAATLIALGDDEIHMGLMSELGPIDP